MVTQQTLYGYSEEITQKQKKKRATKHSEALLTLKEVGAIVGMEPACVGRVEKRVIKKLTMGLQEKGFSYTQSILAVQKFLGVNDPRIILDCLDEDYIEKTRQFAKKLDISDM